MEREAVRQLREDDFYRDVIDNMSDGVYFVNRQRRITYWSSGAERLTGFPASAVEGQRCGAGLLNHVDDDGVELCGSRCPLMATIRDGRIREAHVFLRHADGHRRPVWVRAAPMRGPDGIISGAVETFSDDAATRSVQTELGDLRELALIDSLTDVGNRRFLDRHLQARIHDWTQHKAAFGAIFIDIDHFKRVNDDYGHDVGDETLAMVARTLAFGAGPGDVLARYGGEEFVILTRTDAEGMAALAERLRSLVAASRLVVARLSIDVTISLGGAMVAAGDTPTSLLRRADMALHEAKRAGRDRVRIHDEGASDRRRPAG